MPFQRYPTETYLWVERSDLKGLQMLRQSPHEPGKEAIRLLFKDLYSSFTGDYNDTPEEADISEQMNAMIETVTDSSAYRKLKKSYEDMKEARKLKEKRIRKNIEKIHQNYYLQGPTPRILNALQCLVDKLNGSKIN